MIALGPLPRQRLYTTPGSYLHLLTGLREQALGGNASTEAFEAALASYVGVRHVVSTPMARTGIYLALRALIEPGTRVLMSPYTIADVVNMVLCAGGEPVFCDVERQTCNIDLAEVEAQIDNGVGCVLVTHFYGLACDIEAIAALCKDRDIPLVEDCAQALGTCVNGHKVGTFGDAGIFSFGLFKSVTGFLGGAVISANRDIVDKVRDALKNRPVESTARLWRQAISGAVMDAATYPPLFRPLTFRLFRYGYLRRAGWAGGRFDFDRDAVSYNQIPEYYLCRMTPGQAGGSLAMLDRTDHHIGHRIEMAKRYHHGLKDLPELTLPPLRDDGSHTYQYYPVQYVGREELVDFVLREGRDIALSHHRNCADLPCFADYFSACPNASLAADQLFYLPTYPGYGREEVDRTIAALRRFFGVS
jgi:perosamine synthetase